MPLHRNYVKTKNRPSLDEMNGFYKVLFPFFKKSIERDRLISSGQMAVTQG